MYSRKLKECRIPCNLSWGKKNCFILLLERFLQKLWPCYKIKHDRQQSLFLLCYSPIVLSPLGLASHTFEISLEDADLNGMFAICKIVQIKEWLSYSYWVRKYTGKDFSLSFLWIILVCFVFVFLRTNRILFYTQ